MRNLSEEVDDIAFSVFLFGSFCGTKILQVEGGIDIGSYNNDDSDNAEQGIVLTVGFVPGLKVDVVPLLHLAEVNDVKKSWTYIYVQIFSIYSIVVEH